MDGATIVAVASTLGHAERTVLRLSGPQARLAASLVFAPELPVRRQRVVGMLSVRGASVPAYALVLPAPGSFTGEDQVELHFVGGTLLAQCVREELRARTTHLALRDALPGEFTARACCNGRLSVAEAEGILLLLHAEDARALSVGARWLVGGMAQHAQALRERLLDVSAMLLAELDFGEDLPPRSTSLAAPLREVSSELRLLRAQLPVASQGGELLLLGAANVGKSSLCNALLGQEVVLVHDAPGTTRDLLSVPVGSAMLWDAPGDLAAAGKVDADALALRDRLRGRAGAFLWVVSSDALQPVPRLPDLACAGVVVTKVDLARLAPQCEFGALPTFLTSALSGQGIAELRAWLQTLGSAKVAPGAPLREALETAVLASERAAAMVEVAPELAAADVLVAGQALVGLGGAHGVEPLLDRIYGRFCLGK